MYVVSSYIAGFIGIGLGEAQYYPLLPAHLDFSRRFRRSQSCFPPLSFTDYCSALCSSRSAKGSWSWADFWEVSQYRR